MMDLTNLLLHITLLDKFYNSLDKVEVKLTDLDLTANNDIYNGIKNYFINKGYDVLEVIDPDSPTAPSNSYGVVVES